LLHDLNTLVLDFEAALHIESTYGGFGKAELIQPAVNVVAPSR
jgi:hypothetical protein